MDKGLIHRGYAGSIEVSLEDGCLHGRVLFVNDLITYEGATVAELANEFKGAVDRYLAHCKEAGKRPDRPCSGTFNVRLGEELHRKAATAAIHAGCSLNDFVVRAVAAAAEPPRPQRFVLEHVIVEDLRLGARLVSSNAAGAGAIKWADHAGSLATH